MRALINAVAFLHGHFDIQIATRIHDEGDATPYPGITSDRWTPLPSGEEARYIAAVTPTKVRDAVLSARPDVVWLTSYFSPFTIWFLLLRRFGRLPRNLPVILSVHGELSPSALVNKRPRKQAFIAIAKALRLHHGVTFHVTDAAERATITAFHPAAEMREVGNLVSSPIAASPTAKQRGSLRLVYLSRIHPQKNLAFLLQVLLELDVNNEAGGISLDIYGPVLSAEYWRECQSIISAFKNVAVTVHGPLPRNEIGTALESADLFVLPTLNDNFGYAIIEAWQHSRPVLISQSTPWRGLESAQVGWDLPLHAEQWKSVLLHCLNMQAPDWQRLCDNAHAHYDQLHRENLATQGQRLLELLNT